MDVGCRMRDVGCRMLESKTVNINQGWYKGWKMKDGRWGMDMGCRMMEAKTVNTN